MISDYVDTCLWNISLLAKQQIAKILQTHKKHLSNVVHKFVYVSVSEHFSFTNIINPPDRCGISRSWLNSMIVTWGGNSFCNKAFLWGRTHSDWLGLAPQWMGLAAKWVGLCPPRPIHGCTPAQLGEIHRLGPNEFFSIDWFPYVNCNSVKSLNLLLVVFIFLFSVYCNKN